MTTNADHQHEWQRLGTCLHHHKTGSHEHAAGRCKTCGKYGHSADPVVFVCGRRSRGPIPPDVCPVKAKTPEELAEWEQWNAENQAIDAARAAELQAEIKKRQARDDARLAEQRARIEGLQGDK